VVKFIEGFLQQRYKRFFADVECEGKVYLLHVPNTGSLQSVIEKTPLKAPKCWFTLHNDPKKKTQGTLEAVQAPTGAWVGVNTSTPNKLVAREAQNSVQEGGLPFLTHWKGYRFFRSEIKINSETRLDGVFCRQEKDLDDSAAMKHYVEVKNTTYREVIDGVAHAQFPDAVTERGQKHLHELMKLMQQGHTCELIFTVQRNDVEVFSPCAAIDPEYARLLYAAREKGLIITPLICSVEQSGVTLLPTTLKW
jgi:sugar fermentation stimulation protein A